MPPILDNYHTCSLEDIRLRRTIQVLQVQLFTSSYPRYMVDVVGLDHFLRRTFSGWYRPVYVGGIPHTWKSECLFGRVIACQALFLSWTQ